MLLLSLSILISSLFFILSYFINPDFPLYALLTKLVISMESGTLTKTTAYLSGTTKDEFFVDIVK